MATGASTADLALIVVNARAGITRQTRRHSLIVSTLGVRRLVLAVNKMDLVDWSEAAFRSIETEYRDLAVALGVRDIVCIPLAARSGDNIVRRSTQMAWYRGPTLLDHLEAVEIAPEPHAADFRLPVQLVNRPDADFRGYSGLVASGDAYVGMPVRVLPSGEASHIDRIVTFDGDIERASAGQSVTITLADEIDASRGDVIADAGRPPQVSDQLQARIVWVGKEPLAPDRSYLIKLGTCSAKATAEAPLRVLDLDTGSSSAAERLFINDIGECSLRLDRMIAADLYAESKETGSFILIDPESYDTVGMGFVEGSGARESVFARLRQRIRRRWRAGAKAMPIAWRDSHIRSIVKAISWRATGSIDTFLVTLIITGSSVFAGSVALTETLTKIVFYYGHERIWALISWGKE
jgi:sulfate adenylyltransferase large subunit